MNKLRTRVVYTAVLALLCSCAAGPEYRGPATDAPQAYRELTAAQFKDTDGWKVAAPQDAILRDNWWELFADPQLNALEARVKVSNQNVAAAYAAFMQARALVRQAQAAYWPTLSVGVSATRSRQPVTLGSGAGAATTGNDFSLPFDASWTPDLWGRVRNTVKANVAAAQSSAADLANVQLTAQAEVAVDYFELRIQDRLIALSTATVKAYAESLEVTRAQFDTGIGSDEAVAQAQVQLQTTQAQLTNLGIARAQYEHAIGVLVGESASTFTLPVAESHPQPPGVPLGVPSQLLERRPDVAANERLMAQANAQIGVAEAAYFPSLTLSASAGFESSSASDWFTWPQRFWSVGPAISQTIFDGGLRSATVAQYRAAYDQAVATYRQNVLTAFQQVEDNLAALRILSQEIAQQDQAVSSSQRYVNIATDRYKLGLDPYLDVITAQTSLFSNQQTDVTLRLQQLTASVQLIEALGGGWDASRLPTSADIKAGNVAALIMSRVVVTRWCTSPPQAPCFAGVEVRRYPGGIQFATSSIFVPALYALSIEPSPKRP